MSETFKQMLERHAREREVKLAEDRRVSVAADQRRRQEEKATEERKNRQILEARISDEADKLHPSQMLDDLRSAGVSLEADAEGVITIHPAGKLSQVHRRVIDAHRDEVVAMIRAAQQTETV